MESSEALIDRVYEAALVPTLWKDLLAEVSAPIGSHGGFLFAIRDTYVSALSTDSMGDIYERFIREGWADNDPRIHRVLALNHAGFVTDQDLMSEEELATNEVYVNFYRKNGIDFVAGTIIPIPNGDSIGIALQRHGSKGPVPRTVIDFLDRLRPHLARSSLMANRLGFDRARVQAEALQTIGLPGAVLRGTGRLFAANELFENFIPQLFKDRAGRLSVTDAAADVLLAEALATLSHLDQNVVRSIPVAASEDRLPLVLHIVPVRGAAHDIFTQATALLIVTPVDRAAVPTAEVLQALFDLSPAEARVARGIGEALSIDEVAVSQGVSRETVRTQMKAVFAKTGLSRQGELISLLAGAGRLG